MTPSRIASSAQAAAPLAGEYLRQEQCENVGAAIERLSPEAAEARGVPGRGSTASCCGGAHAMPTGRHGREGNSRVNGIGRVISP